MEHAKKVVLVDERIYNDLISKSWEKPMSSLLKKIDSGHQLSWKRPLEQCEKSDLSKEMHSVLSDDSGLEDSVRSKLYNQILTRFKHTGKSIPKETEDIPETLEEERQQKQQQQMPIKAASKTRRKSVTWPASPIKTRSRKRRKIPKLEWVEY